MWSVIPRVPKINVWLNFFQSDRYFRVVIVSVASGIDLIDAAAFSVSELHTNSDIWQRANRFRFVQ